MYELSAVATQAMPSSSAPLAALAQGASKSRAVIQEVGTYLPRILGSCQKADKSIVVFSHRRDSAPGK